MLSPSALFAQCSAQLYAAFAPSAVSRIAVAGWIQLLAYPKQRSTDAALRWESKEFRILFLFGTAAAAAAAGLEQRMPFAWRPEHVLICLIHSLLAPPPLLLAAPPFEVDTPFHRCWPPLQTQALNGM